LQFCIQGVGKGAEAAIRWSSSPLTFGRLRAAFLEILQLDVWVGGQGVYYAKMRSRVGLSRCRSALAHSEVCAAALGLWILIWSGWVAEFWWVACRGGLSQSG
jgi:hypothetical protein